MNIIHISSFYKCLKLRPQVLPWGKAFQNAPWLTFGALAFEAYAAG